MEQAGLFCWPTEIRCVATMVSPGVSAARWRNCHRAPAFTSSLRISSCRSTQRSSAQPTSPSSSIAPQSPPPARSPRSAFVLQPSCRASSPIISIQHRCSDRQELFGHAPDRATLVTVGGESFELTDQLSPAVEAAIPTPYRQCIACSCSQWLHIKVARDLDSRGW